MKLIGVLLLLWACVCSCKHTAIESTQQLQQEDSSFVVVGNRENPIGVVFLAGGYRESTVEIRKEAAFFIDTLVINNFTVVLLETSNLQRVFDTTAVNLIGQAILKNYAKNPQFKELPAFIGGFSIGGTYAISYVQNLIATDKLKNLKGVFAVDPPLDPVRMTASCKRQLQDYPNSLYSGECRMILKSLDLQFGANRDKVGQMTEHAPFIEGDSVKYLPGLLSSFPVRIYCELDIAWQLKERQRDLYDLNILDVSGFIKYLRLRGNQNATLVTETHRGVRSDGSRNPHSWSIMPVEDILNWLKKTGGTK